MTNKASEVREIVDFPIYDQYVVVSPSGVLEGAFDSPDEIRGTRAGEAVYFVTFREVDSRQVARGDEDTRTTKGASTVDKTYVTIYAGSVSYDREEAALDIDDFIAQLEDAKDDGATHVLGLSGNHRGAKYVCLDIEGVR